MISILENFGLYRTAPEALQHLSNWSSALDETSISNLLKLKKISQNQDAHLQWIPSHVNVSGNELADSLAEIGREDETVTGSWLTYQELYSNERSELNFKGALRLCTTDIPEHPLASF
ncbi:hypothetical protein TNCV_4871141 [Trichonephila clavipes]|nr:hypothetical protein TNCV_4871141 [Trichonephila clavipes]